MQINVNFRIYVDAVVNHMSGQGQNGTGDGGSSYDGDNFDFPGVPYRAEHFTPRSLCPSKDGNIFTVNYASTINYITQA